MTATRPRWCCHQRDGDVVARTNHWYRPVVGDNTNNGGEGEGLKERNLMRCAVKVLSFGEDLGEARRMLKTKNYTIPAP